MGRSGLKGSKLRACRKKRQGRARADTLSQRRPDPQSRGPSPALSRSFALRQDPVCGPCCFSVWGALRQPPSPRTDHPGMLTFGPTGLRILLCRAGTTPRGHAWPKRLPTVSQIHGDCHSDMAHTAQSPSCSQSPNADVSINSQGHAEARERLKLLIHRSQIG